MVSVDHLRRSAVAVVALLSLFAAGFVGASSSTQWTADRALDLDAHSVTITHISATHNLVLSTHALESQRQLGLIADADWHRLIDSAREAVGFPVSPRLGPASARSVVRYRESATAYLDRIASGAFGMAAEARAETESEFQTAVETLDNDRISIRDDLAASGVNSFASHTAIGVLVGLVFPLVAVLVYRRTARRHVETVRTEAKSGREEDRETLLAGLAHELRTPLTGITGFADLLGRDEVDGREASEIARLISVETAELTRRVDDLITAARLQFDARTIRTTDVDLSLLVAEVAGHAHPKDPVLEVPAESIVSTDEALVRQALRNLVINARDHGGPSIRMRIRDRGRTVDIEVADDGVGVDPGALERLSVPFHHGSKAIVTGSVGMGLPTSRTIAEHLGGTLRVDTDEGWTRFVLTLPQRRVTDWAAENTMVAR